MKARAVLDGDDYVLTGTKHWITNAGVSDTCTVFAKTDPAAVLSARTGRRSRITNANHDLQRLRRRVLDLARG